MTDEKAIELSISLPTFDGPFDLLISMIRRNAWPIWDLPVLEITNQFLAYIRAAKDIDIELGGEFIEIASWLVLLKSRELLPVEDTGSPAPREELRRAVLDHATLKEKTDFLRGRYDANSHPGSAGAPAGRKDHALQPSIEDSPTIQDVLEATLRATEAARAAETLRKADTKTVTVADQIRWISSRLASIPICTPVSFEEWIEAQPSAGAQIALFLALLELARKGFLLMYQPGELAAIRVKALQEIPPDLQTDPYAYAADAAAG